MIEASGGSCMNIAELALARHVRAGRGDRPCIVHERADGSVETLTYAQVLLSTGLLARRFRQWNVAPGDRVTILAGQHPIMVTAQMAAYTIGAIATPISVLSGFDTIRRLIADLSPAALVAQNDRWQRLPEMLRAAFADRVVLVGDGDGPVRANGGDFARAAEAVRVELFRPAAHAPAFIISTSGSTGRPKGIVHGHRLMPALEELGNCLFAGTLRDSDAILWTPADWAWIGGWIDVVLPALAFGHTVVACQHAFDPAWVVPFLARHGITHALLTPTAIKRLNCFQGDLPPTFRLSVVATGGEYLPPGIIEAFESRFGATINEAYGMSELPLLIGNVRSRHPLRPGSMGIPYPGQIIELVDEQGGPVAPGEVGEIVCHKDGPSAFLGYWNEPDRLPSSLLDGIWIPTHDMAVRDEDGWYFHRGRNDDLIKRHGYRIGPSEIEGVLLDHAFIEDAAVIGVATGPQQETEIWAYVKLRQESASSDGLENFLRGEIARRLGKHKCPDRLIFVSTLPLTRTGKVSRSELRNMALGRKQA